MTGLDRDVERLLLTLAGGPLRTSEIRDELGLNQNQQVLYRFENKVPGELFEQREERPHPGQNLKVWALTEEGEQWIEEHREEIERPANLQETIEELEALESGLARVEGRSGSLRQSVEELRERVRAAERTQAEREQAVVERIESLAEDVEEVSEAVVSLQKSLESKADRAELGEVRTRQSELSRNLEELQEEVDKLAATVDELDDHLDVFARTDLTAVKELLANIDDLERIEERIDEMEGFGELDKRLDDTAETLEDLEKRVNQVAGRAGEDSISQAEDIETHLSKSEKMQEMEARISALEESSGGFWS
jgi:DNA repair exonuclease SbcCD ATPase subunit